MCSVGSGLCDELITSTEESYRVCACESVCDLESSKHREEGAPRPAWGCCPTETKIRTEIQFFALWFNAGVRSHYYNITS